MMAQMKKRERVKDELDDSVAGMINASERGPVLKKKTL
jgi:hypothetical protein